MAYSYSDLTARVAEAIGDPDSARSQTLANDAIRTAVNELNAQNWWFNFVRGEDIALTLGTREYQLAGQVSRLTFGWVMNTDNTQGVKPVPPLTAEVFVRAGLDINPLTGLPNNMVLDEGTGKVRFDRACDAASVGRIVRVTYYTQMPQGSGLTAYLSGLPNEVGEVVGDLIISCATWRVRRMVPGYDWRMDLQVAQADKMRVRSMVRSHDVFANGRR